VTILLTADLEELAARVRAHDRPRVNPGTSLEEDLATIWEKHKDLHYSFADVVYRTGEGKSIPEELEELASILGQERGIP
jgi:shikimate kinase